MSGSLTRPDDGAAIKDVARRVGNLERRTMPTPPAASDVTLPIRLMAHLELHLGSNSVGQVLELVNLDGSDPNVRWGQTSPTIICSGPYSLPANSLIYPLLWIPDFSSGSLIFRIDLSVWNPGVTQHRRVRYAATTITAPPPNSWNPWSTTGTTTLATIGSDITVDATTHALKTTAGGVLLAMAEFYLIGTPTP
jgi:hypothetical protein